MAKNEKIIDIDPADFETKSKTITKPINFYLNPDEAEQLEEVKKFYCLPDNNSRFFKNCLKTVYQNMMKQKENKKAG